MKRLALMPVLILFGRSLAVSDVTFYLLADSDGDDVPDAAAMDIAPATPRLYR